MTSCRLLSKAIVLILFVRVGYCQMPKLVVQNGHVRRIVSTAFSPTQNIVATGGADKMTKIWDSGSGRLLQTWLSATDGSVRLAFSPDGKLLATASDWGITIRDVKSEEQTAKYRYPDAEIKTLSFRLTGDHLAFGGSFGLIVISVKSGAAIYSERNRDVQALAYAPDGRLVVADESGTLEILDSAYRKTISQTASKGVRSIALSRSGKELVLAYDRAVALWRLGRETLSLVLESKTPQAGSFYIGQLLEEDKPKIPSASTKPVVTTP